MADQPPQGVTPPATKKPVLVYHPRTDAAELRLATKVGSPSEKIMVLLAAMAVIVTLALGIPAIEPSLADFMYTTAAVAFVAVAALGYFFLYRPVTMRDNLINRGRAVWLSPGATREFYEAQAARIEQHVSERQRVSIHSTLFQQVLVMVREDRIMAGIQSSGVNPDRAYETSKEVWEEARDEALYVIDTYAKDEPPAEQAD